MASPSGVGERGAWVSECRESDHWSDAGHHVAAHSIMAEVGISYIVREIRLSSAQVRAVVGISYIVREIRLCSAQVRAVVGISYIVREIRLYSAQVRAVVGISLRSDNR